jgi:MFS family permease
VLSGYGRALRAPHVAATVLASIVARLPISMAGLGTVLYVHALTGSFGSAGIVSGAFALGSALSAPLLGRLVDRLGQTRVLVPGAFVDCAALAGIVVLGSVRAPVVALAAASLVAGVGAPPVGASLRALWPTMLRGEPEALGAAYALDSILLEIFFILGPLLTAALASLVSPASSLVVAAGFAVVGTLWFCALPPSRTWRGETRVGGSRAGALASPGMRTIVLVTLPTGACFGALEIALPAFGSAHGAAALGGPFAAALSVGSAAGGLVYGAYAGTRPRLPLFLGLSLALPAACLPLLLAPSVGVMFPLAALAGMAIAPLVASRNELTGAVAPPGTLTEAFTWGLTAIVGGSAAGSAIAGGAVQGGGWRAGVLIASAFAVAGTVLAFARRRTVA